MKIKHISSREILDSRGHPTIATTVLLEDGSQGWAAVPSGASTGTYEALELRDKDEKRFHGLGVLQAVKHVEETIQPALIGQDASDQREIDGIMIHLDGTENKRNLGANAILSVSLAVARAAAFAEKKQLYMYLSQFNPDASEKHIMPIPLMNIMNGGRHANFATDIQEYMILPIGATSTTHAIRMGTEIYFALQQVLKREGFAITVGDEGGYAPSVTSNEMPFHLIEEAVTQSGYELGKDIVFGIDGAASEFYENNSYNLKRENKSLNARELMEFYDYMREKYPIISMEDIFDEDDWESFQHYTSKTGNSVQIVGDDLYTTNMKRIQNGIDMQATNAVLIKLNQIGTLTETIDAILMTQKNNMHAIISHRSGETEDSFIADLAVAMNAGQIKTGAPARSERTVKYNRLMEIEKELGDKAQYATFPFLAK